MALKEEVLEKLKRRQAEQFALSLPSVRSASVVDRNELPGAVTRCMESFIKYSAKPDAVLQENFVLDDAVAYVANMSNRNIVLQTNHLYWKFFLQLKSDNIAELFEYLLSIKTTEVFLVNLDERITFYLTQEENAYWVFNRKLGHC